MRIQGVKDMQERRLFHGTEIRNVDDICKYNFDLRLAGQHGHVLGKGKLSDTGMIVQLWSYKVNNCNVGLTSFFVFYLGIYFAKHATYADKYSTRSTDPLPLFGGETRGARGENTKIQFLARVVIGKSNVGQRHFQKPDHGSSANAHDSCVDDIENPKVFVIFDPNQIYPEYLIQYR